MKVISLLLQLLIGTLSVFITAYVLPGVEVDSLVSALVVSVLLGVINIFIKPILSILTLPLTIITFGLFAFVLNAALIYGVSLFVDGFTISHFLWAFAFAIILSLVTSFLRLLTPDK